MEAVPQKESIDQPKESHVVQKSRENGRHEGLDLGLGVVHKGDILVVAVIIVVVGVLVVVLLVFLLVFLLLVLLLLSHCLFQRRGDPSVHNDQSKGQLEEHSGLPKGIENVPFRQSVQDQPDPVLVSEIEQDRTNRKGGNPPGHVVGQQVGPPKFVVGNIIVIIIVIVVVFVFVVGNMIVVVFVGIIFGFGFVRSGSSGRVIPGSRGMIGSPPGGSRCGCFWPWMLLLLLQRTNTTNPVLLL